MSSKISFTFIDGPTRGAKFGVDERMVCIIGRADDCNIRIPDGGDFGISKYHCILDINPPEVFIKDLGSTNGTLVNGVKVGTGSSTSPSGTLITSPVRVLNHGDRLCIGTINIQVGIFIPAECSSCSCIIHPDKLASSHRTQGSFICEKCYVNSAIESIRATNQMAMCRVDGEQPTMPSEGMDTPVNPKKNLEVKSFFNIEGYGIIRKLGEGSMGAAYLAEDKKSGGKVALKILLPATAPGKQHLEDFLREIDNTIILAHPSIVKVFNSGYSNGTFYYSMEYLEYGDLHSHVVRSGGKLPVPEALDIMYQILDGIDYAHSAEIPYVKMKDGTINRGTGLVHRDLKPSNIFLESIAPSRVKIADFGLAKAFDLAGLSGCTVTGTFAGTPCFMCRQQLINYKYSRPDIDLWAAVATLYFMLTGNSPRELLEGEDQCKKILESDPIPIRQRNPCLPVPLAELIDQALNDKEKLFFQTASSLKKALQSLSNP